jgi:hypothetical protein
MSFLDDLENNKKQEPKATDGKSPRDLFESCFKYFRHFCSILKGNKQAYDSMFDFTFLNIRRSCKLKGPFDLNRLVVKNQLRLEFKMITELNETIKIRRKDERSANLLQAKLAKDGFQSVIKKDADENLFVYIKEKIPSKFSICLENETDFFIEYININNSSKRKLKLEASKISQETMDDLAQYVLGKKPDMYTESISEEEKQNIRKKIEAIKKQKAEQDEKILKDIKEQQRLEEIASANTFKQRTKRYITKQIKTLGDNLMKRIQEMKNKDDKIE